MSEEKLVDERTAPTIVVDRGQPVIIIVHFDPNEREPDEVNFSYTKPGSERPFVDDGFGQPRSLITRLNKGVYRYVIPTKGFEAGDGSWCFSGEWSERLMSGYDEAYIRSVYHVNYAPQSLV